MWNDMEVIWCTYGGGLVVRKTQLLERVSLLVFGEVAPALAGFAKEEGDHV